MAKYTGKTARVDLAPTAISARFADLTALQNHADAMPAEERAKVGDVRFEQDAIVIRNPQVGDLTFRVAERSDSRIVFHAEGMIPLDVVVNLAAVADAPNATDVTTVLDIEIPAMLRPLIGPKLQQTADTFGDLIAKLAAK